MKSKIREFGYPDFMEKRDKKTYTSRNTLGCLYRIVVSTACTASFLHQQLDIPNPTFAYPGYQSYIASAEADYRVYALELKRIFIRFGITTEAELLLGLPQDTRDESTITIGNVNAALNAAYKALRLSFELRFANYQDDNDEKMCRAYAWYYVAYKDKNGYRSFGWIMPELIGEITASNSQTDQESSVIDRKVVLEVGHSVLKEWEDTKKLLLQAVSYKKKLFNRICDTIRKSSPVINTGAALEMCMFGSVALLLNDHGSDLDIYVNYMIPGCVSDLVVLDDVVRPSVENVATKVKFIKNTAVPIVRMEIDEKHITTCVDICARKEGVLKTWFIRHHYAVDPTNLPFFKSITQWAKACGIVRGFSAEKRDSLLNTGQLQALMLSFLSSQSQQEIDISEMERNSYTDDKVLINKCTNEHAELLGEKILGFLMFAARICDMITKANDDSDDKIKPFRFVWRIPGEPFHEISVTVLRQVAERAKRAYHALAVSRSWDFTISQAAAVERAWTTLEIKLNRSLSECIGDTKDFLALRLSYKSKGAKVCVE